ncbi:MAG: ATP-binding protein [bacterium]
MQDQSTAKITKELLLPVLKEQYEAFSTKDLGVPREILTNLKTVIQAPQVVVITGLRRVGKSTLLAQLAQKYLKDNFYFVSFEDERFLNFKATDFDLLFESLVSLFGEKKTFLFDEVQNVPAWERFVRRLHDQDFKVLVTGSNASLLSRELGTRLTGRSIGVELFPFSFREFLTFNKVATSKAKVLTTAQKGIFLRHHNRYLKSGGIPDALKYPRLPIHKTLYDDVLYRDIATRYQIENVKSLKELAFYLVSNTASLVSYNKLKEFLKLGSVNTVINYIEYLENSWLFFVNNRHASSVKKQQIASKKIYCVDTGLARSVGFSFSENKGRLLENLVFLELKRRNLDSYYFKTTNDYEVDFYLPGSRTFIQVAAHLGDETTRKREFRSLVEAAKSQPGKQKLMIITESEGGTYEDSGFTIVVLPFYKWALSA